MNNAKSIMRSRSRSHDSHTRTRSRSRSRRSSSASSPCSLPRQLTTQSVPSTHKNLGKVSQKHSYNQAQQEAANSSSAPESDSDASSSPHDITSTCKGVRLTQLPSRREYPNLREIVYDELVKYGAIVLTRLEGEGDKKALYVIFKSCEDATRAFNAANLIASNLASLANSQVKIDKIEVNKLASLINGASSQSLTSMASGGLIMVNSQPKASLASINSYDDYLDEYCSKATRTLYIGNLDRDVSYSELRQRLDEKSYGNIIDIEIKKDAKKMSSSSSYAFIQYTSIRSVMKAIRCMDGRQIGSSVIKLGFGKTKPTSCLWLDEVSEKLRDSTIEKFCRNYGHVHEVLIDRLKRQALVYFDSVDHAKNCADKIRGKKLADKRLMVDFASKELLASQFDVDALKRAKKLKDKEREKGDKSSSRHLKKRSSEDDATKANETSINANTANVYSICDNNNNSSNLNNSTKLSHVENSNVNVNLNESTLVTAAVKFKDSDKKEIDDDGCSSISSLDDDQNNIDNDHNITSNSKLHCINNFNENLNNDNNTSLNSSSKQNENSAEKLNSAVLNSNSSNSNSLSRSSNCRLSERTKSRSKSKSLTRLNHRSSEKPSKIIAKSYNNSNRNSSKSIDYKTRQNSSTDDRAPKGQSSSSSSSSSISATSLSNHYPNHPNQLEFDSVQNTQQTQMNKSQQASASKQLPRHHHPSHDLMDTLYKPPRLAYDNSLAPSHHSHTHYQTSYHRSHDPILDPNDLYNTHLSRRSVPNASSVPFDFNPTLAHHHHQSRDHQTSSFRASSASYQSTYSYSSSSRRSPPSSSRRQSSSSSSTPLPPPPASHLAYYSSKRYEESHRRRSKHDYSHSHQESRSHSHSNSRLSKSHRRRPKSKHRYQSRANESASTLEASSSGDTLAPITNAGSRSYSNEKAHSSSNSFSSRSNSSSSNSSFVSRDDEAAMSSSSGSHSDSANTSPSSHSSTSSRTINKSSSGSSLPHRENHRKRKGKKSPKSLAKPIENKETKLEESKAKDDDKADESVHETLSANCSQNDSILMTKEEEKDDSLLGKESKVTSSSQKPKGAKIALNVNIPLEAAETLKDPRLAKLDLKETKDATTLAYPRFFDDIKKSACKSVSRSKQSIQVDNVSSTVNSASSSPNSESNTNQPRLKKPLSSLSSTPSSIKSTTKKEADLCSKKSDEVSRPSLDERIKMLDEMLDKQERSKTSSSSGIVKMVSPKAEPLAPTSQAQPQTSPLSIKPQLSTKIFEYDEKRLTGTPTSSRLHIISSSLVSNLTLPSSSSIASSSLNVIHGDLFSPITPVVASAAIKNEPSELSETKTNLTSLLSLTTPVGVEEDSKFSAYSYFKSTIPTIAACLTVNTVTTKPCTPITSHKANLKHGTVNVVKSELEKPHVVVKEELMTPVLISNTQTSKQIAEKLGLSIKAPVSRTNSVANEAPVSVPTLVETATNKSLESDSKTLTPNSACKRPISSVLEDLKSEPVSTQLNLTIPPQQVVVSSNACLSSPSLKSSSLSSANIPIGTSHGADEINTSSPTIKKAKLDEFVTENKDSKEDKDVKVPTNKDIKNEKNTNIIKETNKEAKDLKESFKDPKEIKESVKEIKETLKEAKEAKPTATLNPVTTHSTLRPLINDTKEKEKEKKVKIEAKSSSTSISNLKEKPKEQKDQKNNEKKETKEQKSETVSKLSSSSASSISLKSKEPTQERKKEAISCKDKHENMDRKNKAEKKESKNDDVSSKSQKQSEQKTPVVVKKETKVQNSDSAKKEPKASYKDASNDKKDEKKGKAIEAKKPALATNSNSNQKANEKVKDKEKESQSKSKALADLYDDEEDSDIEKEQAKETSMTKPKPTHINKVEHHNDTDKDESSKPSKSSDQSKKASNEVKKASTASVKNEIKEKDKEKITKVIKKDEITAKKVSQSVTSKAIPAAKIKTPTFATLKLMNETPVSTLKTTSSSKEQLKKKKDKAERKQQIENNESEDSASSTNSASSPSNDEEDDAEDNSHNSDSSTGKQKRQSDSKRSLKSIKKVLKNSSVKKCLKEKEDDKKMVKRPKGFSREAASLFDTLSTHANFGTSMYDSVKARRRCDSAKGKKGSKRRSKSKRRARKRNTSASNSDEGSSDETNGSDEDDDASRSESHSDDSDEDSSESSDSEGSQNESDVNEKENSASESDKNANKMKSSHRRKASKKANPKSKSKAKTSLSESDEEEFEEESGDEKMTKSIPYVSKKLNKVSKEVVGRQKRQKSSDSLFDSEESEDTPKKASSSSEVPSKLIRNQQAKKLKTEDDQNHQNLSINAVADVSMMSSSDEEDSTSHTIGAITKSLLDQSSSKRNVDSSKAIINNNNKRKLSDSSRDTKIKKDEKKGPKESKESKETKSTTLANKSQPKVASKSKSDDTQKESTSKATNDSLSKPSKSTSNSFTSDKDRSLSKPTLATTTAPDKLRKQTNVANGKSKPNTEASSKPNKEKERVKQDTNKDSKTSENSKKKPQAIPISDLIRRDADDVEEKKSVMSESFSETNDNACNVSESGMTTQGDDEPLTIGHLIKKDTRKHATTIIEAAESNENIDQIFTGFKAAIQSQVTVATDNDNSDAEVVSLQPQSAVIVAEVSNMSSTSSSCSSSSSSFGETKEEDVKRDSVSVDVPINGVDDLLKPLDQTLIPIEEKIRVKDDLMGAAEKMNEINIGINSAEDEEKMKEQNIDNERNSDNEMHMNMDTNESCQPVKNEAESVPIGDKALEADVENSEELINALANIDEDDKMKCDPQPEVNFDEDDDMDEGNEKKETSEEDEALKALEFSSAFDVVIGDKLKCASISSQRCSHSSSVHNVNEAHLTTESLVTDTIKAIGPVKVTMTSSETIDDLSLADLKQKGEVEIEKKSIEPVMMNLDDTASESALVSPLNQKNRIDEVPMESKEPVMQPMVSKESPRVAQQDHESMPEKLHNPLLLAPLDVLIDAIQMHPVASVVVKASPNMPPQISIDTSCEHIKKDSDSPLHHQHHHQQKIPTPTLTPKLEVFKTSPQISEPKPTARTPTSKQTPSSDNVNLTTKIEDEIKQQVMKMQSVEQAKNQSSGGTKSFENTEADFSSYIHQLMASAAQVPQAAFAEYPKAPCEPPHPTQQISRAPSVSKTTTNIVSVPPSYQAAYALNNQQQSAMTTSTAKPLTNEASQMPKANFYQQPEINFAQQQQQQLFMNMDVMSALASKYSFQLPFAQQSNQSPTPHLPQGTQNTPQMAHQSQHQQAPAFHQLNSVSNPHKSQQQAQAQPQPQYQAPINQPQLNVKKSESKYSIRDMAPLNKEPLSQLQHQMTQLNAQQMMQQPQQVTTNTMQTPSAFNMDQLTKSGQHSTLNAAYNGQQAPIDSSIYDAFSKANKLEPLAQNYASKLTVTNSASQNVRRSATPKQMAKEYAHNQQQQQQQQQQSDTKSIYHQQLLLQQQQQQPQQQQQMQAQDKPQANQHAYQQAYAGSLPYYPSLFDNSEAIRAQLYSTPDLRLAAELGYSPSIFMGRFQSPAAADFHHNAAHDYMSQMMMQHHQSAQYINEHARSLANLNHQYGMGQHGTPPSASYDQLMAAAAAYQSPEPNEIGKMIWRGSFTLKNDNVSVAMNYVCGNLEIAQCCLMQMSIDCMNSPIRISQRMRLEQSQMEGVQKKIQIENEHCILIALPSGDTSFEQMRQIESMRSGFITYLQEKRAAGIVNVTASGASQTSHVVHIFPPCQFSVDTLKTRSPEVMRRLGEHTPHLFVVIATV